MSFFISLRQSRCSSRCWSSSLKSQRFKFHTSHVRTNEQAYRPRLVSRLSPTLWLLGCMPILTLGLGTWQIQRLKWKVNLIDELEEKIQRPPMDLPKHINVSTLSDFTYRKVLLRGYWDHARTVLVGPRVRDGTKGFNVVTPLKRSDGSTVLVDRGFVSDEFNDLERWRDPRQEKKEVEVLGMLRTGQKRNKFTPDNNPEKGEWFWIDVGALATHAGGESQGVEPVFIESIFEGHSGDAQYRLARGAPIGRLPVVEVRNMHATYAVTWYSLSALTSVMFLALLRKRARSPSVRMPR